MSKIVVDRDTPGEQERPSSIDPLRNRRVHVLGTGQVAAAVAIALRRAGLIELQDFVVLDPDGCESTEDTGHTSQAATPRLVAISYGPEGANLTLVTSAGAIAAHNIVIASDAIWHASGIPSEPRVLGGANASKRADLPITGRPVPGLFTVGYPERARRSEQFTLDAAAARIATLIRQRG